MTERSVLDAMYSLPVSQRLNHTLPISPPVCTTISIINDNVLELEQTKRFVLNLSHPDPAVFFLRPFLASVTVIDDDSKSEPTQTLTSPGPLVFKFLGGVVCRVQGVCLDLF